MERNTKINVVASLICGGTVLFLLFSFIQTRYFNATFPYNDFLFIPIDRFMDFFNVNFKIHNMNPYQYDVSYPPFANFLAYPFSIFFDYPTSGAAGIRDSTGGAISYGVLAAGFIIIISIFFYKSVNCQSRFQNLAVTLCLLISYPVLFLLDRGNYLMITFILVLIFVRYYNVNKLLSLFSLSAAIALKLYPIFFIFILLSNKRYKDSLKTVIAAGFLSFFPLLLYDGSIISNVTAFLHNLIGFSTGYPNELVNVSFNTSLLGLIKIPILIAGGAIPKYLSSIYWGTSLLIICYAVYSIYRETFFWKKVFIITVIIVLLPTISPDYNLVYLLIPLLVYFNESTNISESRIYNYMFGILLIPKSYLILLGDSEINYYASIQCVLNPSILLFAFLFATNSFNLLKNIGPNGLFLNRKLVSNIYIQNGLNRLRNLSL